VPALQPLRRRSLEGRRDKDLNVDLASAVKGQRSALLSAADLVARYAVMSSHPSKNGPQGPGVNAHRAREPRRLVLPDASVPWLPLKAKRPMRRALPR